MARSLFFPHGILDACQEVVQEERIDPGCVCVAKPCIKGPAAFEVVVPCDGMVVTVGSAGIGSFIQFQQDFNIGIVIFVII